MCLEKLKDYKCELEAIKLYYNNPPIQISEDSDEWFEKRLKNVNAKLNTKYTIDDLKSYTFNHKKCKLEIICYFSSDIIYWPCLFLFH